MLFVLQPRPHQLHITVVTVGFAQLVLLRSDWAAGGFADGLHIHHAAANSQGKHLDAFESLLLSLALLCSNWAARGFADGLHIHNAAANSSGKHSDALRKFAAVCWVKWERAAVWMAGSLLA
jgi:hypothetical protein